MTYDLRYAAGEKLNLIERALAVAMTPAADALFPATALYDTRPSLPAKFGTNPADCRVDIDLAVFDGAMGGWSGDTPAGWTETNSGGGTVVETTVGAEVRSGSAAKFNKSAGVATLHRDFTARAGERWNLDAWARIAAAGGAGLRIQNLQTGKYLTSGGAWQAAAAYAAEELASTSYVNKTLAFTVENWLVCQGSLVTLRVLIDDHGTGGGTDFAFWDDVFLYPTVNFASVHGHNIDPLIAVQLRSSTDNFAANDVLQATLSMKQPAFFGILGTAQALRWWRLKLLGTNTAAPYMGELVLAYVEQAARNPDYGFQVKWRKPQARNRTRAGETHVTAVGGAHPHRALQLQFRHTETESDMLEIRDSIVRRTSFGEHPMIVVPLDGDDTVIHGRPTEEWAVVREFIDVWDSDLFIEESPFPLVTS